MNEFWTNAAKTLNSGLSKCVVLTGNILDLFYDGTDYVPLIDFIKAKINVEGIIPVVYELNGPIQILNNEYAFEQAWKTIKGQSKSELDKLIKESVANPTLALELLRQFTIVAKACQKDLFIIIEGIDMLVPNAQVHSLQDHHIRRLSILHDWLSDPAFVNGKNSVCFLSESIHAIHPRIASLPQLIEIPVPSPNNESRQYFIELSKIELKKEEGVWDISELAKMTAGLSIHALRQLIVMGKFNGILSIEMIIKKIESFIQSQVGEDVVEFKKPKHKIKDLVGVSYLKSFLNNKFLPRIKADNEAAISGAIVVGPIGGGKTYICEAVASEADMVVLILKNIRSQWYGQTDVIFDKLKRVLESLEKVVIFVDEADTQFGSLQQEEHSTEKRLTGKIQALMSDTALKGKVVWLLMTARVHLLSPDIRRPGRGDLIIPILDPVEQDAKDFALWVIQSVGEFGEKQLNEFCKLTENFSAALFSSLKSELKAEKSLGNINSFDDVMKIINNLLPADIEETRRYQTLQALINCTRLDLIPKRYLDGHDIKEAKKKWFDEIEQLEVRGIS